MSSKKRDHPDQVQKVLVSADEAPRPQKFPRGGGSVLTPVEHRQATLEAEREEIFRPSNVDHASRGAKPTDSTKRRAKKTASEDLFKDIADPTDGPIARPPSVVLLSAKNLSPGFISVGCIRSISREDVQIGMPNGIVAFALKKELSRLSDDVSHVIQIGQFVNCVVTHVEHEKQGRKVFVSLLPQLVNSGIDRSRVHAGCVLFSCIKSVEEHGYVVSFGLKNDDCVGFLPKLKDSDLRVGQLLFVAVTSTNGRVVAVTRMNVESACVSPKLLPGSSSFSFDSIKPGFLVEASVEKMFALGCTVRFLTDFVGSVDVFHLPFVPDTLDADAISRGIKSGNCEVSRARVMWVDAVNKIIGLSLQQNHVMNFGLAGLPSPLVVGDIARNALVIGSVEKVGTFVCVQKNKTSYLCFCHASQLPLSEASGGEKAAIIPEVGTAVECRVIANDVVDGISMVSMRESVMTATYVRYDDVKVGEMIEGTVSSIESFGVLFSVSDTVQGVVTHLHLHESTTGTAASSSSTAPAFKVGQKIKGRVIQCIPAEKRLYVTLKRSLIKSSLPKIMSIEDCRPGLISHGFITSIRDFGCIVQFYNDVHGIVPKRLMGLSEGEASSQAYALGQVVKCRVLRSDASTGSLELTFDTNSSMEDVQVLLSRTDSKTRKKAIVGTVVAGTVLSVKDQGFLLELEESKAWALLPFSHLSDVLPICDLLKSRIAVGTRVENLVVIEISDDQRRIVVSRKPILVQSVADGKMPSLSAQLSENDIIIGFVRSVQPYAIYGGFLDGLIGACFQRSIPRSLSANLSSTYPVGLTLSFRVAEKGEKLVLSLKDEPREESSVLRSLAYAKDAEFLSASGTAPPFKVGTVVEIFVKEVRDFGLLFDLDGGWKGLSLFNKDGKDSRKYTVGKKVNAVVIDVDHVHQMVDFSIQPDILNVFNRRKAKTQGSVSIGRTVSCEVLVVKENDCVVWWSLPSPGVGRLAVRGLNPSAYDLHYNFAAGTKLEATVRFADELNRRFLLSISEEELSRIQEAGTASKDVNRTAVVVGDMFSNAIVKTIGAFFAMVDLGNGRWGKLHISEVADSMVGELPLSRLSSGMSLSVAVVAVVKSDDGKDEIFVSSRSSNVKSSSPHFRVESFGDVTSQSGAIGYVTSVKGNHMYVSLSPVLHGRVHAIHSLSSLDGDAFSVSDAFSSIPVGSAVRLFVVQHSDPKKAELSMFDTTADPVPGDYVWGCVKSVIAGSHAAILLPGFRNGRLCIADVEDQPSLNPLSEIHAENFVRCRVLKVSEKRFDVATKSPASDVSIQSLGEDTAITCYVKATSSAGCFVYIGNGLVGRVMLNQLSDTYVKNPEKNFPPGKLLHGRVLHVNESTGNIEISCRRDHPIRESSRAVDTSAKKDLEKGEVFLGKIKQIEPFGLFVSLPNTKRLGLVHISKVSDLHVDDLFSMFSAGQSILVKVLHIDKKKVVLGAKRSYFDNITQVPQEFQDVLNSTHALSEPSSQRIRVAEDSGSESEHSDRGEDPGDDASDKESVLDADEDDDAGRFSFSAVVNDLFSHDSAPVQVRTKTEKQSEKAAKAVKISGADERVVSRIEREVFSSKKAPESPTEFERLLVESPNSSFVWIHYMAYFINMSDISSARAVAERALSSINFREESEKFNVWVALLNLEQRFGTTDSFKDLLKRAIPQTNDKHLCLRAAQILEKSGDGEGAISLFKDFLLKKHKDSCKVWAALVELYFTLTKVDEGRTQIERAITCLPVRKHVKLTLRIAQLEFRHPNGSKDRGRTIFEKLVASHEKRTDIWSVYVDTELSAGKDVGVIRRLLDRCLVLNVPPKKVKFFFKKYLAFEKEQGNDEGVEYVKQKAREFISRI
eukprot:ANDGO_07060.mRNA.1 rRNA biogenesis protein RRP5